MKAFVLAGLAAGLLACDGAGAERFASRALHFSIEKPAGWCLLPLDATAEDRRRIQSSNPELSDAIGKDITMPIYSFMRAWEADRPISATLKIEARNSNSIEAKTGQQALEALLPSWRGVFHSTVVTAPETVTLAGKRAGHMALTYDLKDGGKSFSVASQMWVIPRGDYFIVIGATYPPIDQERDRPEILKFVNSIRLVN